MLFALILAAYVVLSLVYHSWNPVRWTDTKQTQPAVGDSGDEPGEDNQPAGELVKPIEENGISLMSARIAVKDYEDYGIDLQADKAYTIKATVNSNAVATDLVGSVSFKNASSSWASGKTISDYAVLTQSETSPP